MPKVDGSFVCRQQRRSRGDVVDVELNGTSRIHKWYLSIQVLNKLMRFHQFINQMKKKKTRDGRQEDVGKESGQEATSKAKKK